MSETLGGVRCGARRSRVVRGIRAARGMSWPAGADTPPSANARKRAFAEARTPGPREAALTRAPAKAPR